MTNCNNDRITVEVKISPKNYFDWSFNKIGYVNFSTRLLHLNQRNSN